MISAVSIKAFPTNIFPSDDITSADPVASRCILNHRRSEWNDASGRHRPPEAITSPGKMFVGLAQKPHVLNCVCAY